MTAAKSIHSDEDADKEEQEESVGPLSPRSADVFGLEEALIGCLVLTNVVLLAYVCLCRSNAAKKQYAKVYVSDTPSVADSDAERNEDRRVEEVGDDNQELLE